MVLETLENKSSFYNDIILDTGQVNQKKSLYQLKSSTCTLT
jgi:hypothetical protein